MRPTRFLYLLVILPLLPLAFYFQIFNGPISNDHAHWSEFSNIWNATLTPAVSLLALIALIETYLLTRRQTQAQQNDSTFFNLLGLHDRVTASLRQSAVFAGKSTDPFRYMHEKIDAITARHFDLYLFNYYSYNKATDWPRIAAETMAKTLKEFRRLDFEIEFDQDFITPEISRKLDDYWTSLTESSRLEECKSLFGRPIPVHNNRRAQGSEAFYSFFGSDLKKKAAYGLLTYAFGEFYADHSNYYSGYFNSVWTIVKHLEGLPSVDMSYVDTYRATLSDLELEAFFYFSITRTRILNFLSCFVVSVFSPI